MSGTAQAIYALEDSFKSLPGTPAYVDPGVDVQVTDLELDNALQRIRKGDAAEPIESLATRFEGAYAVEFIPDSTEFVDLITSDGTNSRLEPGRMPSSRWFVGVDFLNGTAERELLGTVPLSYSIDYAEGEPVTVSITFAYADEDLNTSFSPSSVQTGGDPFVFHQSSVDVDALTQVKLNSATLSMDNIARLQRGTQRTAVDAVVGAPAATLDTESVVTETDQLELAYGGAGASTIDPGGVSEVSGSFEIGNGSTTLTVTLERVKPATYAWADVLDREADFTEPITYNVDGSVSFA